MIRSASLKEYLEVGGLKLKTINRAIKFNQLPWLKDYVNKLTALRTAAEIDLDNNFFKLMLKAVCKNTMEDLRNRQDI